MPDSPPQSESAAGSDKNCLARTGGTQNVTFSNNDNGVHNFGYTFDTLGIQTMTVVDTANSSIVVDVLAKSGGGGAGGL
jgi:hypothetical protein